MRASADFRHFMSIIPPEAKRMIAQDDRPLRCCCDTCEDWRQEMQLHVDEQASRGSEGGVTTPREPETGEKK